MRRQRWTWRVLLAGAALAAATGTWLLPLKRGQIIETHSLECWALFGRIYVGVLQRTDHGKQALAAEIVDLEWQLLQQVAAPTKEHEVLESRFVGAQSRQRSALESERAAYDIRFMTVLLSSGWLDQKWFGTASYRPTLFVTGQETVASQGFMVVAWLPASGMLLIGWAPLALALRRTLRTRRRRRRGCCEWCGYSLQGLTEPRCPECGSMVDW